MIPCPIDQRPSILRRGVSRRRVIFSLVLLSFVLWMLFLVERGKVAYFEVDTPSMAPTILPGDRLISTEPREGYQRGDLVVFEIPGQPGRMVVKRLVAMYPDEVMIDHGLLFINGQLDPHESFMRPSKDLPDRTWLLEPGQIYLAGDNRSLSLDSRTYGPLTFDDLRGEIVYRTGPSERRGPIR